MNSNHPIEVPSLKQINNWGDALERRSDAEVFTEIARWGADQELEACCALALVDPCCGTKHQRKILVRKIREARRPKPPSLKEQALEALKLLQRHTTDPGIVEPLRLALEQLDD